MTFKSYEKKKKRKRINTLLTLEMKSYLLQQPYLPKLQLSQHVVIDFSKFSSMKTQKSDFSFINKVIIFFIK